MKQFVGQWRGMGMASYPTIESTPYREVLTFTWDNNEPIAQYEQMTWRIHADQSESLLHWERGFLRQLDDINYEWISAQNNGRAEVLKGSLLNYGERTELNLSSVGFANDPRMVQSTRHFEVTDEQLRYTMKMITQAHSEMEIHLQAALRRV